ncbi:kinase subunit of RNA polymerase II carboxy-terminal domain kinase I [Tieghemiomyces parasiticus]|uniref:cyclin-dependent kinase n=1 Tax=Tieghemiomyces parasiticus TaxID=78921 RepID=A0A9W7ZNJ5_9FUNG|nr:kinase subunit of RNA polymerase II carboxy-terminal domain kinase I [Tieghemiomyces parasiticus]
MPTQPRSISPSGRAVPRAGGEPVPQSRPGWSDGEESGGYYSPSRASSRSARSRSRGRQPSRRRSPEHDRSSRPFGERSPLPPQRPPWANGSSTGRSSGRKGRSGGKSKRRRRDFGRDFQPGFKDNCYRPGGDDDSEEDDDRRASRRRRESRDRSFRRNEKRPRYDDEHNPRRRSPSVTWSRRGDRRERSRSLEYRSSRHRYETSPGPSTRGREINRRDRRDTSPSLRRRDRNSRQPRRPSRSRTPSGDRHRRHRRSRRSLSRSPRRSVSRCDRTPAARSRSPRRYRRDISPSPRRSSGRHILERYKEYTSTTRGRRARSGGRGPSSSSTVRKVSSSVRKVGTSRTREPSIGRGRDRVNSADESDTMALERDGAASGEETRPVTWPATANPSPGYRVPSGYTPGARTLSRAPISGIEAYRKVAQVGEGTYGKVYKAVHQTTGSVVALKRFRMESEKEGFPITAMREIKLLRALSHPNILKLHGTLTAADGSIYMIFEYMDFDLAGMLAHPQWCPDAAQLKGLCHQMLSGLAYLHGQGVLHRDIKGSNLLLNRQGQLKFADFGLARHFDHARMHDYTNRVITLWYRPPELLLGATLYGPPADVWGLGCLMLELFTRKAAFTGTDEISQLESIYRIMGTPTAEPAVAAPTTLTPSPVSPGYGKRETASTTSATPALSNAADGMLPTPSEDTSSPRALALTQSLPAVQEDFTQTYWPELPRYPWYALLNGRNAAHPRQFRATFAQANPFLTSAALDLIESLLIYSPNRRVTAAAALQHPYFTTESPPPARPEDIPTVDGDWHEYEYKAKRKSQRQAAAVRDVPPPGALAAATEAGRRVVKLDTPLP